MEAPHDLRIEGPGITLRPFHLDDVPDVTAACQDPELVRWTASIPSPYEESHARAWIETHGELRRDGLVFPYAVVEPSGRLLGCISLIRRGQSPDCAAVGYWVAAWARNQGVATRALVVLSDWAFRSFPLDRLLLDTLQGNVASERVAEKAGYVMVHEIDDYIHPAKPGMTFQAKRWVRRSPA